jgi:hypothetical protein
VTQQTTWKITHNGKSVTVGGRKNHAHEAYLSAAAELGNPSFSEVECVDVGVVVTQRLDKYDDEPEATRVTKAHTAAFAVREYIAFRESCASDSEHAQRGLAEERDALLAENAELRKRVDELTKQPQKQVVKCRWGGVELYVGDRTGHESSGYAYEECQRCAWVVYSTGVVGTPKILGVSMRRADGECDSFAEAQAALIAEIERQLSAAGVDAVLEEE